MIDKILKIAKCKSGAELLKKFPTEKSFMDKYGKEFKKAQMGATIGNYMSSLNPRNNTIYNLDSLYDENDKLISGSTNAEREAKALAMAKTSESSKGGGMDMGQMSSMMGMFSGGKKAQNGVSQIQPRGMAGQQPYSNYGQQPVNTWNQNNNPYFMSNPGQVTGPQNIQQNSLPNSVGQQPQIGLNNSKYTLPNQNDPPPKSSGVDAIPIFGKLVGAARQWKQEKLDLQAAKQNLAVSDIALKAAKLAPEKIERQYIRPEDRQTYGNEFYPIQGTGTNVLAKNGTEIQNTYAPNDLYTDLDEEDIINQYREGGLIPIAQMGGSSSGMPNMAGGFEQQSAGGSAGGAIGSIWGPGGEMAGALIGDALDMNPERIAKTNKATARNIQEMTTNTGFRNLQQQNAAYCKDGGELPLYNPQEVSSIGNSTPEDYYRFSQEGMQSLRTGGNIRQNEIFQNGGEFQSHWGGDIEPVSYNPFSEGTGITYEAQGNSHSEKDSQGRTGIGMSSMSDGGEINQNADLEVENGEPISNDIVYGDLTAKEDHLTKLELPKEYNNKKFKHIVNNIIVPKEQKINKELDKLDIKDNLSGTKFDKLKQESNDLRFKGLSMQLQDLALQKEKLADYQTAINETRDEISDKVGYNISASELSKTGKVVKDKDPVTKNAKYGVDIFKTQDGGLVKKFDSTKEIALQKLKQLYPKSKVEIRETSGDRNVSTQRGLKGSGVSQTDVSIHNLSGAKDYTIYVDGKKITNPDIYKATTHEAAKEQGLYPLTWKKDPYHISAVEEGKGTPYANFARQYPESMKGETALNTISNLTEKIKNNNATANEIRAYKQLVNNNVNNLTPYNPDYKNESTKIGNPKSEDSSLLTREQLSPVSELTPINYKNEITAPEMPNYYQKEEAIKPPPNNNLYGNLSNIYNQVLPYLRPSDALPFDYNQITPELGMLATNREEAVPMQQYHPLYRTPYDISLQDQLNEISAQTRGAQRMVGYNPAAQAEIAAQAYSPISKVLGEQFRMNQAEKENVYGANYATSNDAQLKNIGLQQDQWNKQAQGRANTKAIDFEANRSIAEKIQRNKAEQYARNVSSATSNYRFDSKGRIINMNGLQNFDVSGKTNYNNNTPPEGYEYETILKKKKIEKARNGSIVSSLKRI